MKENYFEQVGKYMGEMMAVVDLIEQKGARPDLIENLVEINHGLKKLTKVV
jgi:hypothetical protein